MSIIMLHMLALLFRAASSPRTMAVHYLISHQTILSISFPRWAANVASVQKRSICGQLMFTVSVQTRLTRQLKEARAEWRAAKEETKAVQAQLDASHKQVPLLVHQVATCLPATHEQPANQLCGGWGCLVGFDLHLALKLRWDLKDEKVALMTRLRSEALLLEDTQRAMSHEHSRTQALPAMHERKEKKTLRRQAIL